MLYHKLLWLFMFLLMARGTSSGSCPMQQFWVAALVFCRLAAYFGLSTTYSHISPMWPGTTPITSNTLQGSCRKQKAIYYAKPMRNYEITIARKIFFKLEDTSEHSIIDDVRLQHCETLTLTPSMRNCKIFFKLRR